MALSSVVSFFSFHAALSVSLFLAYLSSEKYNLIPMKYRCCAYVDLLWHPIDRTVKWCSYQHKLSIAFGPGEEDLAI